jgi:hypothetical protein
MPNLAPGNSQGSTLIRIEVEKNYIITGEPLIWKSTVLRPFFTKTLVQMAWQGRADQARSQIM